MKRTKAISNWFNDIYEMVGDVSEGGFTKLAPLAMPAAPAFFFGWAIGTAVYELTTSFWAALFVGVAAAIGYEGSGFLSFHVASLVNRRGGNWRQTAVYPAVYVAVGIGTLWLVEGGMIDNVNSGQKVAIIGTAMLLIMANIYAALATHGRILDEIEAERVAREAAEQDVQEAKAKEAAQDQLAQQQETERLEWEREQEALDRELQRELERQKVADKTAVALAKLQVNAPNVGNIERQERRDDRQDASILPTDWRQLSSVQRHELAHATRDEREGMFPDLKPRTRREWHSRLDKIALQNGSYFKEREA